MEFGVFTLPTYFRDVAASQGQYMRSLVDYLASAEELGLDSVWVNEHHFDPFGGMIPSTATILSALAQRTKRVRLGSSVALLALGHPIRQAEEFAMVDLMSGGRLDFGVGRGFVVHDFEAMGIPVADAEARMLESLDVILKAWSRVAFNHSGTFYKFENLEVWPHPEQTPHPPIWQACSRSPATAARVGTMGHNLLTAAYLCNREEHANLAKTHREALAAAGHSPRQHGVHYQAVLAEDGAKARATFEKAMDAYLKARFAAEARAKVPRQNFPPEPLPQLIEAGRVLVGTPDEAAETLRKTIKSSGITGVRCTFLFGDISFARARESMELFAKRVVPAVRSAV